MADGTIADFGAESRTRHLHAGARSELHKWGHPVEAMINASVAPSRPGADGEGKVRAHPDSPPRPHPAPRLKVPAEIRASQAGRCCAGGAFRRASPGWPAQPAGRSMVPSLGMCIGWQFSFGNRWTGAGQTRWTIRLEQQYGGGDTLGKFRIRSANPSKTIVPRPRREDHLNVDSTHGWRVKSSRRPLDVARPLSAQEQCAHC